MVIANALQMIVLLGASKKENANLTNAQQIVVDSVMNARTVQARVPSTIAFQFLAFHHSPGSATKLQQIPKPIKLEDAELFSSQENRSQSCNHTHRPEKSRKGVGCGEVAGHPLHGLGKQAARTSLELWIFEVLSCVIQNSSEIEGGPRYGW